MDEGVAVPFDENGDPIQSVDDTGESPYERAVRTGGQEAGDALLRAAEGYYGSSSDPTSIQTGPNSWVSGHNDVAGHGPVNWNDPSTYQWLVNAPGRQTTSSNPGTNRPGPPGTMANYGGGGGGISGLWDIPSDLMDKWSGTFTAPDPNAIMDNPLVKNRIALGMDAIQGGAASRGTLLTPGVQKSIADYAGQVGSGEYWNLYNAAANEFMNSYNMFEGDRSRRANTWLGFGGFGEQQKMNNFTINRANTLDQFDLWHQLDSDWWNRQFLGAQLGHPQ